MKAQKNGIKKISRLLQKKNIGAYKSIGKELCKKGTPIKVNTHDFPDARLGKVSPYGIYDRGTNQGWVSVSISSDTAKFAVNGLLQTDFLQSFFSTSRLFQYTKHNILCLIICRFSVCNTPVNTIRTGGTK